MAARSSSSRFYPNPALHSASAGGGAAESKSEDDAPRIAWLSSQLPLLAHSVSAHWTAGGDDDDADAAPDETLYEGLGGAAYAFLHVSRAIASMHHSPAKATDGLQSLARQLSEAALSLADRAAALHAASRHQPRLTFYFGTSGVLATRILTALHAGDSKRMQNVHADLASLLALRHSDPSLPDEILYGRAGLLHALLLVDSCIRSDSSLSKYHSSLRSKMDVLFDEIVSRGESFADKPKGCPLMWAWHDKRYLGAAHGVTGILVVLMQCTWRFKGEGAAHLTTLLQSTLAFLLSIRLPSGNCPSSLPDDPRESSSDKLVQWCHGAPGLIFACLAAYDLWSQPVHLQAALDSASVVWERGLLKKGLGLCHGIAGNAYVFMRLFDVTRDRAQLYRAYSFLHWGLAGPQRDALATQPDVPDSLANGRAGCACAVADCMRLLSEGAQAAAPEASATSSSSSSAAAPAAAAAAAAPSVSSKPSPALSRSCFPGMDARLP